MVQKKEDELRAQSSIVDQLRTYIGENLPNTQIEKLQRENEEGRQNMMGLLQENENLRSTAELLNVRLTSLNEILSIQETELLRFQTRFTKESRGQEEDLLTKWREKVFALLVQLKSQAIIHEKEDRTGRAQVSKLLNFFVLFRVITGSSTCSFNSQRSTRHFLSSEWHGVLFSVILLYVKSGWGEVGLIQELGAKGCL